MKHVNTLWVLLVFVSLSTATLSSQQTAGVDYQKMAEGSDWQWDERSTDPFHSGMGSTEHDVRLTTYASNPAVIAISIMDGGKELYSWRGHRYSVFRVVGNRLYFCDFNYIGTGGSVVAVDLTTSKEIWRSALKALPNKGSASAYITRLNIDVQDPIIMVRGLESGGRYFEIKDVKTGETIGHKLFPKEAEK